MNDRIDERKVSRYLYGTAGRAGTFCVDGDMSCEPEYIKAEWLWLTLERSELEARLMPIEENMIHPCGSVIQWNTYCGMNERAYREYRKSDEWKRKREAVMRRATKLFPVLSTTVNRNGREIQFMDVDRRPICENDGCTDKAIDVHHLTYERIGGERLSDLIALCRKCHVDLHRANQKPVSTQSLKFQHTE